MCIPHGSVFSAGQIRENTKEEGKEEEEKERRREGGEGREGKEKGRRGRGEGEERGL